MLGGPPRRHADGRRGRGGAGGKAPQAALGAGDRAEQRDGAGCAPHGSTSAISPGARGDTRRRELSTTHPYHARRQESTPPMWRTRRGRGSRRTRRVAAEAAGATPHLGQRGVGQASRGEAGHTPHARVPR
eukprot:3732235-Pleurochrysis_carterae.AAC.1